MENPGTFKILFIINPISGGKNKNSWETAIREYFQDLPHRVEMYVLTGKDDTGSVQYRIEKLQADRVVAVGGDGTVSLVAKQILGIPVIMGILPAGSANGMAKELGIPENQKEALDIITGSCIKCCDVIRINDEDLCIHLSDVGLNARLVKYFDESKWRGMWGYARMVIKALLRKRLMSAHIVSDDRDITTSAFMIVIANASKYGSGAMVNPVGDHSDGLFEVVILRKFPVLQLFKMLLSYKNFRPENVEIFHTKNVTITLRRRTHFQIDGEYKGKTTQVTATVLPAQLQVLVNS